jgi:hypothetical protein
MRCLVVIIAALWSATAFGAGDAPADHQLGTQYSPLRQINKDNIKKLTKAWEFHTGDDPNAVKGLVAMEDPSISRDDRLQVGRRGCQDRKIVHGLWQTRLGPDVVEQAAAVAGRSSRYLQSRRRW